MQSSLVVIGAMVDGELRCVDRLVRESCAPTQPLRSHCGAPPAPHPHLIGATTPHCATPQFLPRTLRRTPAAHHTPAGPIQQLKSRYGQGYKIDLRLDMAQRVSPEQASHRG